MPPVHDEIGAVGHFGPGGAQGLHIAIAQRIAHPLVSNKRRIAHNEIGLRPGGGARAHVAPLRHLRGFVGHLLASDGVGFVGAAIPAAQELARVVVGKFLRIPGQHGIAAFDVAVVVYHGRGHGGVAPGADVPLQVANPQHQFGQGGGAFVQLDAAQLLQGDGFAFKAELVLRAPQGFELVDHFALQALQVLQRDIQKIGTATGGVEYADGAQVVVEFFHLSARFCQLGLGGFALQRGGFVRQHQGGGLGVGPLGAQRLDDGGQHQALDVGAWRVVRTQGVALGGVEGALQQRAENGGLYLAPVGARGLNQQVDLRGGEQQAVAVCARAFEQLAVEVQHVLRQRGAEAALVHIGPEDGEHFLQHRRLLAVLLQQALKAASGQQLHVFSKHGKQAAGEVGCYHFRSC